MNDIKLSFPDLTFREKALVSFALMAAIFMFGRHFVFTPLYEDYSAKRGLLNSLAQKKSMLASRLGDVDSLLSQLRFEKEKSGTLQKELARLQGSLLQKDQLKAVFDLLEEMAAKDRMNLLDISVNTQMVIKKIYSAESREREVHQRVEYEKSIVNLSVESDYKTLAGFVQKLSELPLAMSIAKINISSDPMAQKPALVAKLQLELYALP